MNCWAAVAKHSTVLGIFYFYSTTVKPNKMYYDFDPEGPWDMFVSLTTNYRQNLICARVDLTGVLDLMDSSMRTTQLAMIV